MFCSSFPLDFEGRRALSLVKINFCYLQGAGFFIKKFIFSSNEKRQIGEPVSGEAKRMEENILSPWVGSMKISSQFPSKRNKKKQSVEDNPLITKKLSVFLNY